MIILSDKEDRNWGVFVYHDGTERVIYTMPVEHVEVAPKEFVIKSFDGSFRVMIGTDGAMYTYPINRKGLR